MLVYEFYRIIIVFIIFYFIVGCNEDVVSSNEIQKISVDVRMEIQILDSTYHLYSRPHTQIYFTTYIINKNNMIEEVDQSDTTSCPNGWGVKLVRFDIGERDTIVLGAACESYDGPNYREEKITYPEIENRIDTLNHASLKRTFAIYYK
jgi:hypothetical protein